MPGEAITEHDRYKKGLSFQQFSRLVPNKSDGTTVMVTGVRTQESLNRLRAVSTKKEENYITKEGHVAQAHPIYDWSSQDVWKYVHEFNLDYNRTYDIFNKTGKLHNKFLTQRVCPPFGEEPLRGLWLYSECFPEMWHKMINRVQGVATAFRYSNTPLYGVGNIQKPEGLTYQEWAPMLLDTYSGAVKATVAKSINTLIKQHYDKTDDHLHDEDIHPLTGTSWRMLCKLAIKGDLKGRTSSQGRKMAQERAQERLGIKSADEAALKYGKESYLRKRFKIDD
jgi:predicted phosphoadenosine phosphosulfate sulfurtransferase